MKKIIVLIAFFSSVAVFSQTKGDVTGKIFFNYHYDMTGDVAQNSGFEIQRAYLGYKYTFNDKFSAKVTLDVGKDDGSDYTAYLKAAQLDYKATEWLKLSAGLIGTNQFSDQEKLWGYRYILKSYQDEYGFGPSADLGLNAEFKLLKTLKMNLFVLNGEGYKKVQDLYGKYKVGGNLVYNPIEALTFKVYYSGQNSKKMIGTEPNTTIVENPTITNLALFAGYEFDKKFRIGAEYNAMYNGKKYSDAALDHDLNGYSIYSTYVINDKFEIFGRYDQLESNKVGTATTNWNASKDGSAFLTGIQYIPVKGVSSSLNFQSWNYDLASKNNESLIYLNLEYKF